MQLQVLVEYALIGYFPCIFVVPANNRSFDPLLLLRATLKYGFSEYARCELQNFWKDNFME
jgi:hypothetical protein